MQERGFLTEKDTKPFDIEYNTLKRTEAHF